MSARSHLLPGACPIDGSRKRLVNDPRQGVRHPEAVHDAIREKARKASERIERHGWRYPFGYLVGLREPNGTWHFRDARTYEEAVEIRDEEMKWGDYELSWLKMKIT